MAASAELAALGPSRSLAKRPREPTVSSDDDEDDLTVSSLLLSNRCQRRPQPRTRQETDKAKPVPGREPPRSGARPNRGSDSEHASAARASSSSQAPGVSEGRPRSLKATTSTLGSTRNGTSKRGVRDDPDTTAPGGLVANTRLFSRVRPRPHTPPRRTMPLRFPRFSASRASPPPFGPPARAPTINLPIPPLLSLLLEPTHLVKRPPANNVLLRSRRLVGPSSLFCPQTKMTK